MKDNRDKTEKPHLDLLHDLIKLAKEEGLGKLSYKNTAVDLSFSFPEVGGGTHVAYHPHAPTHFEGHPRGGSSQGEAPSKGDGLHEIRSPFVGTFYRSPAPDEPIYCKEGDKIHVGKVLCILEAMKIMNEIESDIAGEIVEICVENESLVEFGQLLFKVRKA